MSNDSLEVLIEERKLIKERESRVDKMTFSYVKVIVVPFFALLGYSLLNIDSEFKYVLVVIPYFTIFSILVMGTLYKH